ncbi:MAG: hypothetical protein Q9227_008564 [Pyrenula ochraceoflavens]
MQNQTSGNRNAATAARYVVLRIRASRNGSPVIANAESKEQAQALQCTAISPSVSFYVRDALDEGRFVTRQARVRENSHLPREAREHDFLMAEKAPPTTTAVAIAVAIVSSTIGYFLGQGSSIGLFGKSGNPRGPHGGKQKKSWPNSYDVNVHMDSSDEDLVASMRAQHDEDSDSDREVLGELKSFEGSREEVKLVMAVRTDLGMGKGKIAAQCSHATLACYKSLLNHAPSASLLHRWEQTGQPKIAVQTKSEDELQMLQAQAMSLGLCSRVIHDAGRTQIAAGSATVLGVLGPKSVVDQVTGGLKLL